MNELVHVLDDLHLIRVLALASTLNLQLLVCSLEGQADETTLSVCSGDSLDWCIEPTSGVEGLSTELGRHCAIRHGEAESLDVGSDVPIKLGESQVVEAIFTHALEEIIRREGFNRL